MNRKITRNFNYSEFSCPCCGKNNISIDLVNHLQEIRDVVGPMFINSGCRCKSHNEEVGGEDNSAHIRGLACDIYCSDSWSRYNLLAMIPSRFPRYGIRNTFIHVDIDKSLPQDVCWVILKGD